VKTEHLLPSPFKTDCMTYEKNIGKTDEYKSFHECEEKCKNKIDPSFKKSENLKKIDCHCAKDCKTEIYYFHLLEPRQYLIEIISIIIKRENREEHIYHLPAISFTKYLCSLAEIMSMWIGISLFGEGKRIIDLFLAIIRSRIKQKQNLDIIEHVEVFSSALSCFMLVTLSMLTYNTFLQYINYEYIFVSLLTFN